MGKYKQLVDPLMRLHINISSHLRLSLKLKKSGEQMAKIFVKSGENEWLLKIKSGELYFNVAKVVAKEKFNPEQALTMDYKHGNE